MILLWRRRRGCRRHSTTSSTTMDAAAELTIPTDFRCPISLELMKDPVTLPTGITYDRNNIEAWIFDQGHNTCPVTNQVLAVAEPIPNHTIRRMIQHWCVEKRSYGIERISTPRIPLGSSEASDLLAGVESSTADIAAEFVERIVEKVRESERNRRVILSSGGARVFAAKFDYFARESQNGVVLEKLLSGLALLSKDLDLEAKRFIGSVESLKRIVLFLIRGDLARRRDAVLLLKEMAVLRASELSSMEGVSQGLVNVVKEPICAASVKDSLVVIHHIITKTRSRSDFVSSLLNQNMISELLEMAINADRSLCEKVLGVLDELCECEQGRELTRTNAMAVPVVVKKMLRVSDLATELSVSILWKLCKEGGGEMLDEALQVGAFQKLLVLVQMGWSEGRMKEKVMGLLKLLNSARGKTGKFECVESADFKDLKGSF